MARPFATAYYIIVQSGKRKLATMKRSKRDHAKPAKKKKTEEDKERCSICLGRLAKPMKMCGGETGCQTTFHELCISEWVANTMSNKDREMCPTCKTDIVLTRNRWLENYLGRNQRNPCGNVDEGCEMLLNAEEMEKHRSKCMYRVLRCTAQTFGCEWSGMAKNINSHESDCEFVQFGDIAKGCKRLQGDLEEKGKMVVESVNKRAESALVRLENCKKEIVQKLELFSRVAGLFRMPGARKNIQIPLKSTTIELRYENSVSLNLEMRVPSNLQQPVSFWMTCAAPRYPVALAYVFFYMKRESVVRHDNKPGTAVYMSKEDCFQISEAVFKDGSDAKTLVDIAFIPKIYPPKA